MVEFAEMVSEPERMSPEEKLAHRERYVQTRRAAGRCVKCGGLPSECQGHGKARRLRV
jgi:hypothetical protein